MPRTPSTRLSGMKINSRAKPEKKVPAKKPDVKRIRVEYKHRRNETKNHRVRHYIYHKDHFYLRFYELLMEYFANKLNIHKDYFRVCFFFYEGYCFKRAEFTKYAKIVTTSKHISLSTLIDKGFVRQLVKRYYTERDLKTQRQIKIPFYCITLQCSSAITTFYSCLNEFIELDAASKEKNVVMTEDVAQLYNSYVRKINNFRKGLGQFEELVPVTLDSDEKPKKTRGRKKNNK